MELLNRKRLQSQFSRLERHSVDFVREVNGRFIQQGGCIGYWEPKKTKRPMFSHQPWSLILGVISSKSAHRDRAQLHHEPL